MTRLVAALLYVLLLCMQQEALRHQLGHLRGELAQVHEQAVTSTVDGPCDECSLLAGAAYADIARLHAIAALADFVPVAAAHGHVAPPTAAHHYAARAPPALS